ncbi:hypothetical protein [Acrocarpospora sp. B8E8]|uniref:hypothetical protein n=1 Tax=Acrocarpospora sp. B8E8 TaxID=3153572 RepID=UPI00325F2CCC
MTTTTATHRLTFHITREEDLQTGALVWVAAPVDHTIGCVAGETLADLYAEVEQFKHFVLDLPEETPIVVEYVYALPGVQEALESLASQLTEAGISQADRAELLRHISAA